MGAGIPSLPPPVFVSDADGLDPNLILADMIAEFETASGRTLQPAQVERLLINLYAYRESLVRNAIQYAAQQNLLAFASFPMIDYLGQLLSVTRLAAQPAVTTLQFTLTGALTVPFTIAAGTLAGTSDGRFAFATSATVSIAAGATTASVAATATAPGAAANGYLPGQVSIQLNPNALIASVTNTSDDHRRVGAGNRRSSAHAHSGRAKSVQRRGTGRRVPVLCARRGSVDHRRAGRQSRAGSGERLRADRTGDGAAGGGAEQCRSRELRAARESGGGPERRHRASAYRHRERARGD